MKTTKTSPKVDIEKLLAARGSITNNALKVAIDAAAKRKEEEQAENLLRHIESIQNNTSTQVENLRKARKVENQAKKRLEIYAAAEQQFYVDGDIAKYNSSIMFC